MKNTLSKLVLGLFLIAVVSTVAGAQPDDPQRPLRNPKQAHSWWKNEAAQKKLGLTEEQVANLGKASEATREKSRELAPKLRETEKNLNDLFLKDEITPDSIRKVAAQRRQLQGKMERLRIQERIEFARILSPEQRKKAAQFLEKTPGDRPGEGAPGRREKAGKPQNESDESRPKRPRAEGQERGPRGPRGPQEGLQGQWWKRERIQKHLELTPEQIETLNNKVEEIGKQGNEIRPKMREATEELANLFLAEKIDLKTVKSTTEDIRKLRDQIDEINIERRIAVAETLKPEQRRKLAEVMTRLAENAREERPAPPQREQRKERARVQRKDRQAE